MRAKWLLRKLRFIGAVTVGCAIVATAPAATADPIYPQPDPDPFYAQPADMANYQPGDVIASRIMPPLLFFPDTTVTAIKFRSTNSQGAPIAAITTVLTPREHQPDGPVLSYQHIINGLGRECAVSRVLFTADPNLFVKESMALNVALRRGWSVALPDHLGPNFAYGAAKLGGQITLDGIRAVQRLPELQAANSPVAMAGYSGGGMATAWAAALAPTYAPELRIAGAAAGGVPMNMVKMVSALGLQPHPAFGLAMAAAIGLEREYPDRLPISTQMNQLGLAARNAMADGCTNEIMAVGAGHSAGEFAASTSMIDDPGAREVLEENSLELFDGVPNMPVFEWHSPSDPLIPVDAIVNTDHRYCAAGVRLEMDMNGAPEHLSAAVFGMPSALAWVDARLRGEPAPSNC
ncbi:lipase [Nocardia sp. SYP-A9097]|uniref:lipase family protein n=1 Tax=Nocardia sp. SYP-A9097 TaxID=2663237 RepID=UPI00129BFF60|nr:lipase family protein [Nocardia sp. SYP-A9097]MRH87013.1 lipase [Nocardia sp. SYP-A9097]